jgi:alkanesulfonate monooxygenase SsuD/methylene tetrahydromethanopterin reductase-like flavin-dependent oxidoreductase (luciferase family)
MEFHLFLPQMRLSFDRIVTTARAAEASGFGGMAGMDHLVPPGADTQPMYEAMVTNTWIAAHTERLTVSSLVLCDAFRNPAVLARQAVSLDHASGGRYELGIGWGSWRGDFSHFGVEPSEPQARVQRLRETLEILRALWAGESLDYDGEFHQLHGAAQAPVPLTSIPIVIGGAGPKTLGLVREFADWWNVHAAILDKLDDARAQVGDVHVSIQQMVAYVPDGADRDLITEEAQRRFGHLRPVIGTGPELVEHYGRLEERGIERIYVWFCDFAPAETLAAFGRDVIAPLAAPG